MQEDLISRAAAVKAALDLYHTLAARRDTCRQAVDVGGVMVWTAAAEIAQAMVRRLVEMPGAEKTGKWLEDAFYARGSVVEYVISCSCCHTMTPAGKTPYCPYCGARMIGGETSAAE